MRSVVYYSKKETRSFKEYPFNNVDSLILSILSYYDFQDDVPSLFSCGKKQIKDINLKKINEYIKFLGDKKKYINLLTNVVNNPRYNLMYLDNYYEKESIEQEMQFKALTIENNDFMYVSFMGTKASLISWKEDFNMSYLYPIPSQKLAVKYLNKVMLETTKRIYVGGHSKGGNLAVYASAKTFFFNQLRIKRIFSHDGPGFVKEFFNSKKYHFIKNKIDKTIPSTSIVGTLFYSDEPYKVIKASGIGPAQHTPVNWLVDKDKFVYLDDTSIATKHFDSAVSNWLDSLSVDERINFVNALYKVLSDNDFDAINIPEKKYFKIYSSVRKGIKNLDEETRTMVIEILKRLAYYEKLNIIKKGNDD